VVSFSNQFPPLCCPFATSGDSLALDLTILSLDSFEKLAQSARGGCGVDRARAAKAPLVVHPFRILRTGADLAEQEPDSSSVPLRARDSAVNHRTRFKIESARCCGSIPLYMVNGLRRHLSVCRC
jgi:hypothetical protein